MTNLKNLLAVLVVGSFLVCNHAMSAESDLFFSFNNDIKLALDSFLDDDTLLFADALS